VDGQDAAQVVQATGERVRKTAGAILDALDTVQVGTGDPPGLTRESATPSRGAGAERTVPALVEPARSSRAADAVVRGL
jgi:hypothetical protein